MESWTIAGFAAMVSLFTVNAMQFLKPFVELLPGITLAKNKQVHDNLLRLMQVGINLGATAVLAVTTPLYRGIPWWQIALIGLGQATASHVTYALNSTDGTDTLPDAGMSTPVVAAETIPTVPRP